MTELLQAVADVRAQPERIAKVGAALYEALQAGKRQVELVEATGYTRETIRRLVREEKIRRGEITPTKRDLAARKRRERS